MSDLLVNSQNGHIPASQRVPSMARPFVSERAMKTLDIVCYPLSFYFLDMTLDMDKKQS